MAATRLQDLLEPLGRGLDLSAEQASAAALELAEAEVPQEAKMTFLRALTAKGESATEVAAFASTFRKLVRDPGLGDASMAIDIVGTGGDKSGSFNISSTASLIVAASGQPVVKHGNRSITSQCGSADFLEALGIELESPLGRLQEAYAELNFVFLFAPAYHPAFKEVVPIRKALAAEGQRSIFNLLGPLINPAKPGKLLMGVFAPEWVKTLGGSLEELGLSSGAVVNSALGNGMYLDELSCAGDNIIAGVGDCDALPERMDARDLGLQSCTLEDLKGGEKDDNLALLEALMSGQANQGLRDTVCLNAGMALLTSRHSKRLEEGIKLAGEILEKGALRDWLQRVKEFYTR